MIKVKPNAHITVACIQSNATSDKDANLKKTETHLLQAISLGATHLFLPEVFNYRGQRAGLIHHAESLTGPSITLLKNFAKAKNVWIHGGSICEKIPESKKMYNTSVIIDPTGKIIAKYRKINLFDATLGETVVTESQSFEAGNAIVSCDMGGIHLGTSICFDIRFGSLFEKLKNKSVEAIAIPASFTTPTGKAHWEILVRARAIETHAFVIAANQTGYGASNIPTYGNSMIVDPWGTILSRASENYEGVITASIDPIKAHEMRQVFHRNRQ